MTAVASLAAETADDPIYQTDFIKEMLRQTRAGQLRSMGRQAAAADSRQLRADQRQKTRDSGHR